GGGRRAGGGGGGRGGGDLPPAGVCRGGGGEGVCGGLRDAPADERELEEGARAGELREQRLHDGLLPGAARDVGVGGVELVLAHARVNKCSIAVHVLDAFAEAPALPAFAPRVRRIGTVELVGQDRLRDGGVECSR